MEESKETVPSTKEPEGAVLVESDPMDNDKHEQPSPILPTETDTDGLEPQVAYVEGTGPDARAMTTLRQTEESVRKITTAGKKPTELFKSLDPDALDCAMAAIKTRIEEEIVSGPFLLTEIDHWDVERERIVFVTKINFFSIRYDFISQVVSEIRTVPLVLVDELIYGPITYPRFSVAHSHKGNVLKVSWGKDHQPSFGERWNPFSTEIRYVLYQSHPMWKKSHSNDTRLSVKDFYPDLQKEVSKVKGTEVPVKTDPVHQTSYWGLGSLVHNQSELGFNKRRGGVDW